MIATAAAQLALDCEPMWDLDDAVTVEAGDRNLLGQGLTDHQIVTAATVDHDGRYL